MDKLLTTTATTTTDTSNKVQKSHNNNNNNNNLYTQTDLQAQNSNIPSRLTHFTHTHKTQIIATSKIHRFQPPSSQTQICKLKNSTDSNHPHKHRSLLQLQKLRYSKLKKHHPHHSKPQLHRFQALKQTHTHTHTHTHKHTQIYYCKLKFHRFQDFFL